MTTWSCKAACGAVALSLLTACDGGAGFALPKGLTKEAAVDSVRRQAVMADGAITLVAPDGYCVDLRSLQPRFALLARCDVLGAPTSVNDLPLVVITASFVADADSESPPTPQQIAQALDATLTSAPRDVDMLRTFDASAPAPAQGLENAHTRAQIKVNSELLSLALFSPKGAPTPNDVAQSLFETLIARLKTGS